MALARAEASVQAIQTVLSMLTLVGMMLVGEGPAPLFALGLLSALAALEGWGNLAASDLRAQEVERAVQRLAVISEGKAHKDAGPVISHAPVLGICGMILEPGSRVLIEGASGVGKTRLAETMIGLRLDAPQSLLVDGHDPRSLGLGELRSVFAHCAQDAPLIAGSVADNLGMARAGLNFDAMQRALKVACADDVIEALPDGLHQWLGGDGARLSGGQRRRIALARALLTDRAWLVLDEPSEGLDHMTEARLIDQLDDWLERTGTGLILISHRPAMAVLARTTIRI